MVNHTSRLKMTKWDFRFIALAKEVASWSKDGKQVGCVITDINTNKVLSTGYNGLPKSLKDTCLSVLSKDDKSVLVLHAEHNALEHLSKDDYNKDLSLYVTKTPCRLCALKIVNSYANIKRIYYIPSNNASFNKRYNSQESLEYLESNGIQIIPIDIAVDYTTQIVITNYLSRDLPENDDEITVDYISNYIYMCSTLINNLDNYLKKDTSQIDAINEILDEYNYKVILKFVQEKESSSAVAFLEWYDRYYRMPF